MTVREAILQRIGAYLASTSMSERTFGMRVCGDHKLVSRLRQSSVTLERIEKAEAFMRDNPPVQIAKEAGKRAASLERPRA
jgi:hypothetical protein